MTPRIIYRDNEYLLHLQICIKDIERQTERNESHSYSCEDLQNGMDGDMNVIEKQSYASFV